MTTDEQTRKKDALLEHYEAKESTQKSRDELKAIAEKYKNISRNLTRKLDMEETLFPRHHVPAGAFKPFRNGLELPTPPSDDELQRAIDVFDQARERLHTALRKAEELGIKQF